MRLHIILIATTATLLFTLGCEVAPQSSSISQSTGQASEYNADLSSENTATLWVKGIGCPGCIPSVEGPLTKLLGVDGVSVDLPTGKVTVALNSSQPATREQLVNAIGDSGFTLDRIEMPQ